MGVGTAVALETELGVSFKRGVYVTVHVQFRWPLRTLAMFSSARVRSLTLPSKGGDASESGDTDTERERVELDGDVCWWRVWETEVRDDVDSVRGKLCQHLLHIYEALAVRRAGGCPARRRAPRGDVPFRPKRKSWMSAWGAT